jgi:hypothetical protein
MSAKIRDVDLSGIDALAAVLRSRRAKQAFQKALKKGQSPTLSLTAAISASLVSAAAKENVEDPLAGLAAVDDLSAFQEDCLPGGKYVRAGHDHDLDAEGFAHRLHGASYRDDPFASRFASRFTAGHDDHDGASGEHCPSVSLTAGQHPSSHSMGALEAHAMHDGHAPHEAGHGDHAVSGETTSHNHAAAEAGHEAHDASAGGEHSAHLSGHEEHRATAASAHAGHDPIVSDGHGAHDMPGEAIDMDDLAEAMPDDDHGHDMGGMPMAEDETAAPAAEEEHHASLGDMDLPPAEDLSAGSHNHSVI